MLKPAGIIISLLAVGTIPDDQLAALDQPTSAAPVHVIVELTTTSVIFCVKDWAQPDEAIIEVICNTCPLLPAERLDDVKLAAPVLSDTIPVMVV